MTLHALVIFLYGLVGGVVITMGIGWWIDGVPWQAVVQDNSFTD